MKGVKKILKEDTKRRIATVSSMVMYGIITAPTLVYAGGEGDGGGGTGASIQGMENLKQLALAAVGAIGFIPLIKGIMSFGTAVSQRDNQGIAMAAAEIAGGAIMVGAAGILTYLGISN